jgi:hypothetical protein
MTSVPRITRYVPAGLITRAEKPEPVIACLHWLGRQRTDEDVKAFAVAWTRHGVEVLWVGDRDEERTDWIPAEHVRRVGQPRPPQTLPRPGKVEYIAVGESQRPAPQAPAGFGS